MNISIKYNELSAEEFILLWETVWGQEPTLEQTKLAMEHTLFRVSIFDDDIVPPIKPCQNQAAYFVYGALKKEPILEGLICNDFKCERTLCSNSCFEFGVAFFPTERFRSLFTNSSGLYSGA